MVADFPKRKPTRAKNFDYTTEGAYFLTICAQNSADIFSRVYRKRESDPPVVELTACGRIVERNILDIPKHFPNVTVENYAIMPNHVHIMLMLSDPGLLASKKSVSDVICAFKSLSTAQCAKELGLHKLWQRSFYDHYIRGDRDFYETMNYIESNSEKWLLTHTP